MRNIRDFLIEEGFDKALIDDSISPDNYGIYDLESCESVYTSIFSFMREDFDDWYILAMFTLYSGVFLSGSCIDKLGAVKVQFASDMWATYMQYEFSERGISSIFELMDSLVIGEFEAEKANVCDKVKSVWLSDYSPC